MTIWVGLNFLASFGRAVEGAAGLQLAEADDDDGAAANAASTAAAMAGTATGA